jgi:REP element-mobilizing transposase RayT
MVRFNADHQMVMIPCLLEAVQHIDCRPHFIATDPTHVHILVSWKNDRTWQRNRTSLKKSITLALKERFGRRPWLVEGSSRKRVRDEEHFQYLMSDYLPSHRGWKWSEARGLFR